MTATKVRPANVVPDMRGLLPPLSEEESKKIDVAIKESELMSGYSDPGPRLDTCFMCGGALGWNDVYPYHIPYAIPGKGGTSKDCTPSCMYCAKVFKSKKALEKHEENCDG